MRIVYMLQEISESELVECQRQLEQVQKEVSTKNNEIKELLKAVDCMQSKVCL